ncbi:chromate transporter [Mesomycoplasma lagogenitalium]|uniref:Chromate transporter n=1 Tax=Mesomycoplasma lagogenitalium TaxID=171286 RepID=A0ABY8LXE4_9BACT|nr:chromate transporter [Mesomycoplasma lagogenitalium]WGI36807.1 chromate transporter [Mesomycoplasma lagogenitalium]
MKKKEFWKVFLFIIKCTFIGFGGGNALMPIIKKYAVDEYKWITEEEFDSALVTVNLLPGAAVIEMISYIAITKLGKLWGTIVTLIAIMPHIIVVMALYYLITLLPIKYLYVINVGVLSALIGVIIGFSFKYLKASRKDLLWYVWIALFILTLAFCLFVPAPFNLPAIPLILGIIFVFIYEFIKIKRGKK